MSESDAERRAREQREEQKRREQAQREIERQVAERNAKWGKTGSDDFWWNR
jgi:hypothetical protein